MQEVGAGHAVGGVLTGHAEIPAHVGADGEVDTLVVLLQLVDGDLLTDAGTGLEIHTEIDDAIDLGIEDVVGEPVVRDPVAQHAAGRVEGLEDRHRVPPAGKLVGAGKACRAAADDGDLLVTRLVGDLLELEIVLDAVVPDETLHGVDADGAVELDPVALRLAGVGADPAHDGGEGVLVGDDVKGLVEALLGNAVVLLGLPDVGEVAADVLGAGAGEAAGRGLVHVIRPKR